jgi:hypothetical protein
MMKNYVFVYYNDNDASTREIPQDEAMAAWNKWFGGLGASIVDAGNPFAGGGQAVEKSGVTAIEMFPATGYTIVKAESMQAAVEMAKDCPVLEAKNGAVRVYETLPM